MILTEVEKLNEECLFNLLFELYTETTGHPLSAPKLYEKGKDLYRYGEIPKGIYYIKSGSIKVTRLGNNGREVILRIAQSQHFVGYLSLLKGWSYKTTATCLQDSEVFFIPKTVFTKCLKTDVKFANGLVDMLCNTLSYTTDEVTNLVTKSVKQRLCTVLLTQDHALNFDSNGNNGLVIMKKKDIASLVGTVPETLSRQLAILEEQGLIKTHDKSIEIINRAKLLQISEIGD